MKKFWNANKYLYTNMFVADCYLSESLNLSFSSIVIEVPGIWLLSYASFKLHLIVCGCMTNKHKQMCMPTFLRSRHTSSLLYFLCHSEDDVQVTVNEKERRNLHFWMIALSSTVTWLKIHSITWNELLWFEPFHVRQSIHYSSWRYPN